MFHPAAGVVEGVWSQEANRTGRPRPRIIAPRMLTAKIIDCLFASIHSGVKIKPHLFIPLINADRYRKLHFQKKLVSQTSALQKRLAGRIPVAPP